MKHVVLSLIAATALLTAGCGSKSSGRNLDTALSYVPKNAAVVVAIDTNPDGDQWQQVDHLLGKFPFGGRVKQQLKSAFTSRTKIHYDKVIKPLLGSDVVLAILGPRRPYTQIPYVLAWKLKDEAAAHRQLEANSGQAGTIDGLDVYGRPPTNFAVIKDGTLVIADTMPALEAAIKRPAGAHMTESDFNAALGDLNKDSLVRIVGNAQKVLAWSTTRAERNVQWLSAVSNFAVTLRAESDGIEYVFKTETDSGGLKSSELPLASGTTSPPVVKRPGEIGFAVRNPAQFFNFGLQATRIADPRAYAKYLRDKAKISRALGADFERDLIGQLTGNATVSVDVGGAFAIRAGLRDPAGARTTLKKFERAARNGRTTVPVSPPPNGKGFYAVTLRNGKKYAFGVVGNSFIVATDEARAAQFAAQSPSSVPGAKGSLVVYADARALANTIASRRGQDGAAQILTTALGDLTGSVETETDGFSGTLKLQIK